MLAPSPSPALPGGFGEPTPTMPANNEDVKAREKGHAPAEEDAVMAVAENTHSRQPGAWKVCPLTPALLRKI